jgi:hypothetical protein
MQQLDLPLKTNRVQQVIDKARGVLEYAKAHPDEILLAVMTLMLLDIESDIDELEK